MRTTFPTITIILLFISFFTCSAASGRNSTPGKATLTGNITDKTTRKPIPGATVYIPDLKTGAVTDSNGTYKIENLPQTKVLVQVSFIGYNLVAEYIDLAATMVRDFELTESVTELKEIVVTGLSKAAESNRTPTPISTIPPLQLLETSASNIIDAIARQPGVSQITTGAGISKPVIRGLGYNRVATINDGIRQEGQQWGDEHGIEIDEYSVNKVEILKGPASLSYGSDAMAGVINMLSAPTLPEGTIQGRILANFQTNNGLFGYSANLGGNLKGFLWDFRYSNRMAHAYQNKYDGFVLNSGFRENSAHGMVGLNKSWGYTHLNFSAYNMMPGIVEGERDSATGKLIKPVALNDSTEGFEIATDQDDKSYTPETPYQKIHHYKAVLNSTFILKYGSLKSSIGFQQNRRQEYGDILNKDDYGLYFLLNTLNYDLRYNFPEIKNLSISTGINGMLQNSLNKGSEFLIPDYNLFDFGLFVIAKKTVGQLDLSAGLRYDTRNVTGKDLYLNSLGEEVSNTDTSSIRQFAAFSSNFTGISGSFGATLQLSEKVYTKLNFSRGFRAPNISEISANGTHEGSINYIIGDPGLKAENSFQLDYAVGFNAMHISGEIDLFSNFINNYIFLSKLQGVNGGDSITDGYSTFRYATGNAQIFGGEFTLDIHPHPLDWLHFENTISYVQSVQKNQPDSAKYLPYTPAPRLTSELRASKKKLGKSLVNAYTKFEVEVNLAQNHFYAAFNTETATPGYTLLNFGMGADVLAGAGTLFSIYISVNNLTDVAYQSHLSRLKYAAVNNVTGRAGVYNMGRNLSFKLIVPVNISKK
ncbi:MAG: TonB-dependent receptor [Bacteroidales bacterium]|nr:TonB-dependent receptor [Bacteroidales bacterium]